MRESLRNRQRGERELEKEAESSEGVGERGREVRGIWRKRQRGERELEKQAER